MSGTKQQKPKAYSVFGINGGIKFVLFSCVLQAAQSLNLVKMERSHSHVMLTWDARFHPRCEPTPNRQYDMLENVGGRKPLLDWKIGDSLSADDLALISNL